MSIKKEISRNADIYTRFIFGAGPKLQRIVKRNASVRVSKHGKVRFSKR